jgi:hypothetical protein
VAEFGLLPLFGGLRLYKEWEYGFIDKKPELAY